MSSQYPGRSGSTSDDCEPGFSSSQLRRAREAINILSSLGGNSQSVQGNDATNSRTSSTHGDVRARCEAALSRLDTIRPRERPKFRSEARDVESL